MRRPATKSHRPRDELTDWGMVRSLLGARIDGRGPKGPGRWKYYRREDFASAENGFDPGEHRRGPCPGGVDRVVGAGVEGLAAGQKPLQRFPGLRVLVDHPAVALAEDPLPVIRRPRLEPD